MYCPKCGSYLEEGTTTCPNCGAQVHKKHPGSDAEETRESEEASDQAKEQDAAKEQDTAALQEAPEEAAGEPDAGEDAEETRSGRGRKRNTRTRRPWIIILILVVVVVSIYALYTMWEGEETEETAAASEEAEAEADAGEGEEEPAEADEEEAEEETAGTNIVIEQENPADSYELEAFEESWSVIQQQGLDGGERFYRDFVESVYEYSNLSFTLEGDTVEDLDDYYYIKAIFNKPIMVPVYLTEGDTYTIETDELRGTVLELTCEGTNEDEDYLVDGNGQIYYCAESGSDRMAELYTGSGDRMEAPFYEGVLRIRKDAVTGDALTHGPYITVTEEDLAEEEESWFNVVAFDKNGYVKQLIFDGD